MRTDKGGRLRCPSSHNVGGPSALRVCRAAPPRVQRPRAPRARHGGRRRGPDARGQGQGARAAGRRGRSRFAEDGVLCPGEGAERQVTVQTTYVTPPPPPPDVGSSSPIHEVVFFQSTPGRRTGRIWCRWGDGRCGPEATAEREVE